MDSGEASVFFYGLFMDESVLAAKGVHASSAAVGFVDGYRLRIGRRATLLPDRASRAHGVLMTLQAADVNTLYADASVADYAPESVTVVLRDGTTRSATCYNLPAHKLEGANPSYAQSLLALATRLGLPDDYLDQIRKQAA